jgi:hypothetical protein
MFRFLAKVYTKIAYRWRHERESALNDLNGRLAERTGSEKRTLVKQLNKEADTMDARIKEVAAMEEKGFWLCDNGHEMDSATWPCGVCDNDGKWPDAVAGDVINVCTKHWNEASRIAQTTYTVRSDRAVDANQVAHKCLNCGAPGKLIKRSEMSGQEKYESDKERGEAEKIVASKREQARGETENAEGSEQTAKFFRDQAAKARSTADKIRSL